MGAGVVLREWNAIWQGQWLGGSVGGAPSDPISLSQFPFLFPFLFFSLFFLVILFFLGGGTVLSYPLFKLDSSRKGDTKLIHSCIIRVWRGGCLYYEEFQRNCLFQSWWTLSVFLVEQLQHQKKVLLVNFRSKQKVESFRQRQIKINNRSQK